jgi:NTE family protein
VIKLKDTLSSLLFTNDMGYAAIQQIQYLCCSSSYLFESLTWKKMLTHLLGGEDYALALTPGFFRFYAHIGVLQALEECNCLRPSHITGSSAGALVGAFLASGMKPTAMANAVLAIEREHIWDVGGIGGLLKGQLFEQVMEKHLPVMNIEEAPIPFCATAYDLLRFRTTYLTTGKLSTAARASCTFPGLLQPVMINNSPHIDGGVWDHVGLLGLEEVFRVANNNKRSTVSDESISMSTKSEGGEPNNVRTSDTMVPPKKLIVNVVFGTARGSVLPKSMEGCRVR